MAKKRIIWTKFYWQDWLSDAGLRRCSVHARGLWMDMLCIAAQHDPIGLVAVNSEGLSEGDIARLAGVDPREASTLIGELERNDVFARDRKGIIYSRRMVRDAKKAATAQKNGKNGGNPSLSKTSVNSPLDKPQVKAQDKPYKLETISQKPKQHSKEQLDELERACREAAGLENDPSPGLLNLAPLLGLLDAGFTLEDDILPCLRAKKRAGHTARSWSFFVAAIQDSRSKRLAVGSYLAPEIPETAPARWENRVVVYGQSGVWLNSYGPEPGYDGCKVPDDILEKHGFLKKVS